MRKTCFDFCRVIACVTVVLGHSTVLFWDCPPESLAWALWNLLSLALHFCLPLFFMLSGALLMGRKTMDFRRHMRRTAHLVLLFYFWSAFCRLADACCGRVWMDGTPLPLQILQGYFHLWYLPALAMCYCALPLLHGLAHGDADNVRRGSLLLFGIVVGLVTLEAVPAKPAWLSALLSPWQLSHLRFLVYLLIGMCLSERELSDRTLTALGIASLAGVLLFAWLNRRAALAAGQPVDTYYGHLQLPTALPACFAFSLCQRLEPWTAKHGGLWRKLADCTLGIYVMHPVFLDMLRGRHLDLSAYSAAWLFPLCFLSFLFLSLGLTLLLKKIPPFKKLLS